MTSEDHKSLSWPYPMAPAYWNEYDDSIDYCGPQNAWYKKGLSRYIFGVDCNKAYWAHDNRYRSGDTKEDREFADKQMQRDQAKAIMRFYSWWHPIRYPALLQAHRRWEAVRIFGKGEFEKGK